MVNLVITAALVFVLTCNAAKAETELTFSEYYPFTGETIQFTCSTINLTLEGVSKLVFANTRIRDNHYQFSRDCTDGTWTETSTGLNVALATYPHFNWVVSTENSGYTYNCIVSTCAAPQLLETAKDQRLFVLNQFGEPWWTLPTPEKVTVTENEIIKLHFRCVASLVNLGDTLSLYLFHGGAPGFNETVESSEIKGNASVSASVESAYNRDASQHTVFQCSIFNRANPSRISVISKPIEVLYMTDNIQFSSSNDASYSKLQEVSANQWSLEISGPTDLDYIISCHANGLPYPTVTLHKSTDQSIVTGSGSVGLTIRPANEVEKVFNLNCDAEYSHEGKYNKVSEVLEVKLTGSAAALAYSFVTLLLASLLSMHFM